MDKLEKLFEKLGTFSSYKKIIVKSKGELCFNRITNAIIYLIVGVYMIIPVSMIIISTINIDIEYISFYWQSIAIIIIIIGVLFVFSLLAETSVGIKELRKDFTEEKVAKRAFEEIKHDNQYVEILISYFTSETLKSGFDKITLLKNRKENRIFSLLGGKIAVIPILIAVFPIISKTLEFTISNIGFYFIGLLLIGYIAVNIVVAMIIKGSIINKYIYWQELIKLSLEKLEVQIDSYVIERPNTLIGRIKYLFKG